MDDIQFEEEMVKMGLSQEAAQGWGKTLRSIDANDPTKGLYGKGGRSLSVMAHEMAIADAMQGGPGVADRTRGEVTSGGVDAAVQSEIAIRALMQDYIAGIHGNTSRAGGAGGLDGDKEQEELNITATVVNVGGPVSSGSGSSLLANAPYEKLSYTPAHPPGANQSF